MNTAQQRRPAVAGSLSPNGRDLALLSFDGIRVTDLDDTRKPTLCLPVDVPGMPTTIQWHPSVARQPTILSAAGSSVLLWDIGAPHAEPPLLAVHERAVTSIDASRQSPDIAVSGSLDGLIALWDLRDHSKPSHKLYMDQTSIRTVKMSPLDADLLASTHGSLFRVWDMRKLNQPICSVEAHPYTIKDIEWHAHIRERLATCSSDKSVKFWNVLRVAGQHEKNTANAALDRVVETGCALSCILQLPYSEAVMAFGDEALLLDCRVKRISDRKARLEPTKSWQISYSRAVGYRFRGSTSLQCLTLRDGNLHFLDLPPETLRKIGAEVPESLSSSSQSVVDGVTQKSRSVPANTIGGARTRNEFGGLSKTKAEDQQETNMAAGRFSPDGRGKQWPQATPLSDTALNEQLASIEDEDDDVAVIASENPSSAYEPTKLSIVPAKRVSGAVFAPNGTLVRFLPLKRDETAFESIQPFQDFRGITESIWLESSTDVSDNDSDSSGQSDTLMFGTAKSSRWIPNSFEHSGHETAPVPEDIHGTISADTAPTLIRQSSTVSLHNFDHALLPASKNAAQACTLTGTPHEICTHNQGVCDQLDLKEHAQAWAHAAIMVKPIVPLQQMATGTRRYAVAKRSLVEIKRRDGRGNDVGLDLAYDEPHAVTTPHQRGPICWASHPFGRAYIRKMLRAFAIQGDIQMLAMLTVVFAMATPRFIEEEKPDQLQSAAVKIKFKGRADFQPSSKRLLPQMPLPDAREFGVHCQWRQNYADQLYAWDLPFARLEILQANITDDKDGSTGAQSSPSLLSEHARSKSVIMTCSVCWEVVGGYCILCSECDHAYHPSCLDMYIDGREGEQTPCAAGCGCYCSIEGVTAK